MSRKDGEKWKFKSQTRSLSGRREGKGWGGYIGDLFFVVRRFDKKAEQGCTSVAIGDGWRFDFLGLNVGVGGSNDVKISRMVNKSISFDQGC